jgi:hypothetical protein
MSDVPMINFDCKKGDPSVLPPANPSRYLKKSFYERQKFLNTLKYRYSFKEFIYELEKRAGPRIRDPLLF